MKETNYKEPKLNEQQFHCPHCRVFAQQEWRDITYSSPLFKYSRCLSCNQISIWKEENEKMVYPLILTNPYPHKDMPEKVREIYNEARNIAHFSPRATAALLRLALEELCIHLGETKGNLYTKIGNLKKKGLPESVIKGLDIVRITGNDGAHSGVIDLNNKDNEKIVDKLFNIVNFIIEKTITEHETIKKMFDKMPETKKEGIKNRDNKN